MIQFLVHNKGDTVGVATVDIRSGQTVRGKFLDTQEEIEIQAISDIPLGHKLALQDHAVGRPVIKYGHDIGKVVQKIRTGEHVHIHNLKTKRW